MIGVVLIILAMVLVLPVGVMVAGAAWSMLTGWLYDADDQTEAPST